MKIAVTGASGHLGHLVVQSLLDRGVSADEIVGIARTTEKAADLVEHGVEIREGDYERPDTLAAALSGVDRLVMISSSEVGRRFRHHQAVLEAAQGASVDLIVYTSLLRADSSPLELAEEHRQTETAIRDSGLPSVILRNGWYNENYAGAIAPAPEHGAIFGSAGAGRIAAAARQDFADAAAAVVTEAGHAGKTYELAGDRAFTMAELAGEVASRSGKAVEYRDLPEADYCAMLVQIGLPEPFAALLADSDAGASRGALFDDGHQLSQLIGRPTTPIAVTVKEVLGAGGAG